MPRLLLTVKMQFETRDVQYLAPIRFTDVFVFIEPKISEQVEHDGLRNLSRIAERQIGHGANLLFVLAADAGIDRGVTGVVRSRSQFVNDQTSVGKYKEFCAEHADIIELLNDFGSDFTGAVGDVFV